MSGCVLMLLVYFCFFFFFFFAWYRLDYEHSLFFHTVALDTRVNLRVY